MPDAAPAAPIPATPAPAAAPPPVPAAAKPEGAAGGHAPPTEAKNETPPPFDPAKAGLVFRAGAEGKPGKWVRPVKADGETFDFDPTDPEAWSGVSMTKTAKRLVSKAQQEKAEVQKAWNELLAEVDGEDPDALVEALAKLRGKDPGALRQKMIENALRRAKMSPEAREAEDLKQQLKERDRLDQEAAEQHHAQQVQHARAQWDDAIGRAIVAEGLPDEPEVRFLIASDALAAKRSAPDKGVDVAAIARKVSGRIGSLGSTRIGRLDGDELLAALGDELVSKVRRADAARAIKRDEEKARTAVPPGTPESARAAARPPEKKGPLSLQEKREKLRAILDKNGAGKGGAIVP